MLTIFMLLNATTEWLRLSPQQRERVVAAEVAPIFAASANLRLRFYDAEAFSGRCSDILTIEADALDDYTTAIDALRNSPVYTVPYFNVVDIIPTRAADFVS